MQPSNPADTFSSNLQVCYEILLYLASRLARLQPGETFEFITSDPSAQDTIPEWCDMRGFVLLENDTLSAAQWRFVIQK